MPPSTSVPILRSPGRIHPSLHDAFSIPRPVPLSGYARLPLGDPLVGHVSRPCYYPSHFLNSSPRATTESEKPPEYLATGYFGLHWHTFRLYPNLIARPIVSLPVSRLAPQHLHCSSQHCPPTTFVYRHTYLPTHLISSSTSRRSRLFVTVQLIDAALSGFCLIPSLPNDARELHPSRSFLWQHVLPR